MGWHSLMLWAKAVTMPHMEHPVFVQGLVFIIHSDQFTLPLRHTNEAGVEASIQGNTENIHCNNSCDLIPLKEKFKVKKQKKKQKRDAPLPGLLTSMGSSQRDQTSCSNSCMISPDGRKYWRSADMGEMDDTHSLHLTRRKSMYSMYTLVVTMASNFWVHPNSNLLQQSQRIASLLMGKWSLQPE